MRGRTVVQMPQVEPAGERLDLAHENKHDEGAAGEVAADEDGVGEQPGEIPLVGLLRRLGGDMRQGERACNKNKRLHHDSVLAQAHHAAVVGHRKNHEDHLRGDMRATKGD